ncbi:Fels-1 Prophage Protein-like protein [compost metagenome]
MHKISFKFQCIDLMKIASLILSIPFFICGTASFAKTAQMLKNPVAGVLCDKYICADKNGVSKSLTAKYLGQRQAKKVFSQGEFDTSAFTFANGVFCDTKTKLCHVDRYFDTGSKRSAVDTKTTKKLFGK